MADRKSATASHLFPESLTRRVGFLAIHEGRGTILIHRRMFRSQAHRSVGNHKVGHGDQNGDLLNVRGRSSGF